MNGRNGYDPSFPFSLANVCEDADGNFLVIDSNDDTVHLLDPKGEFLRSIMSTDDGLRGITCIAIDTFGWLLRITNILKVQPDETYIWRRRKIMRMHYIIF